VVFYERLVEDKFVEKAVADSGACSFPSYERYRRWTRLLWRGGKNSIKLRSKSHVFNRALFEDLVKPP